MSSGAEPVPGKQADPKQRVGVWLIGALGDVATTSIVGARLIARGLAANSGLVSALDDFQSLPLVPLSQLVFGGHDVRSGSPRDSARQIQSKLGYFGRDALEAIEDELEAIGDSIRPGLLFGCSQAVLDMSEDGLKAANKETVAEAVGRIRQDLAEFKRRHSLESVVVVHLTSTEPLTPWLPAFDDLSAFEAAIASNQGGLPASVLYAYAAFQEHASFVNFTPSLGSSIPAMQQLAERQKVVHAGRDGKTGETLVRTMLAPMFLARNLKVLSWSGFNVLGNRDGQVLADPEANKAKTSGKDAVLSSILGGHLQDSLTRIDYVPSLSDWKTAWDLIHFEGFLGTKMTLQFTWQGADSALAAPLVLDLVRFCHAAKTAGRVGIMEQLACFFKAPMGWSENAFPKQVAALQDFARGLAAEFPQSSRRQRAPSS